jgi:hypothetical protein
MSDTPRLPDPSPEPRSSLPDPPASPNGQAPSPPARAPVRRRNRKWVWFFVALVLLTLTAVTSIVVYRWGQMLTPERLEAARKLWMEKGPKDYQFRYLKRLGGSDRPDRFAVVVRGGKVRSVTLNGTIQLPARLLAYHSMDALFDDIEAFLKQDREPNSARPTTFAQFAPEDGHLVSYMRGGVADRQRVSLRVEEFKPLDGKEP